MVDKPRIAIAGKGCVGLSNGMLLVKCNGVITVDIVQKK